MPNDAREGLFFSGNVQKLNNAMVEEVSTRDGSTGYLMASASAGTIRLNVNRSTVILNSLGQTMCLCDIREGMWIDSLFSSRSTRSIPPQSNAFLIIVRREIQSPVVISTGRIASIDPRSNFLYTGNPGDINTQTRYLLTGGTPIIDRMGNPIHIRALRPGQLVRITHSNAQTAGIPPQTTAFHVQVL